MFHTSRRNYYARKYCVNYVYLAVHRAAVGIYVTTAAVYRYKDYNIQVDKLITYKLTVYIMQNRGGQHSSRILRISSLKNVKTILKDRICFLILHAS